MLFGKFQFRPVDGSRKQLDALVAGLSIDGIGDTVLAVVEGQVGDAGPPGARHSFIVSLLQEAQVLQLSELQLEQELFPAPETVLGTPLRVALKTAKVDIFRRAGLWHLGQSAICPD